MSPLPHPRRAFERNHRPCVKRQILSRSGIPSLSRSFLLYRKLPKPADENILTRYRVHYNPQRPHRDHSGSDQETDLPRCFVLLGDGVWEYSNRDEEDFFHSIPSLIAPIGVSYVTQLAS
jgi:hypothetical protein